MEKRIFSTHRSPASLWLCLVILLASCSTPTAIVPPDVITPIATTPAPEATTSVPTEITPESTATPTATVEGYNVPVFSTGTHDCFFLEGVNTAPASPGEGYLQNQIILSGDPEVISDTVRSFPQISQEDGQIDPLPEAFYDLSKFDIQLYSITPDVSVPSLVSEVNQRAIDQKLRVLAEPNYITRLPVGVTGSGDGGSGINGDPDGIMSPAPYGYDQFIRQWAFSGAKSIHLFDDNNPHNWTPGPYSGRGVRVVVFDTTPLPEGAHEIYWSMAPFHLCIWQPGLRFIDPTPQPTDKVDRIPKEEHGLFVSGVAHGLAPISEYYLIEVLDSQARGDVYTLVRAIALYLTHPIADTPDVETVFNMSLGLDVLDQKALDPQRFEDDYKQVIDSLRGNIEANFSDSQTLMDLIDTFPVISLKLALMVAEQNGVVVVAAAGNDGSIQQQVPADFSHVIGVASTTYEGDETCFTNTGDVAAPSGDGDSSCLEETPGLCPEGTKNCLLAVISTVTQRPEALSGYAYWTGTSFSAPMASGLAALIREARSNANPQEVRDAIICGVTPLSSLPPPSTLPEKRGAGLINVENTLDNCLPTASMPTPTPTP